MRSIRYVAACAAAALILAGCSSAGSSSRSSDTAASASGAQEVVTLKVGASPSPHAKILQYIQDHLAAEAGLKLDIVEYTDYVQPNVALNQGELDANFYQTVPYLNDQTKEYGYDFVPGKGVHLEPLAVYSEKVKNLKDFPEGGKIGIIADVTNQARALKLLADQGFVKISDPKADSSDININTVEKLKKFEFVEVEGAQLVRSLADVDIAVINGNFAQEGGLSPHGDGLAIESTEGNDSANLLVWKKNPDKADAIAKLEKLLHSDSVRTYIESTWKDGSVIPTF
ncbi:MetQ/NlpA family ABC transporter substrate-binding protein [Schaalia sp. lx-100]|uniref:MetQ/NlpA family ABC transporter substrate-binding protein n=1 Tax=Schaalia sp. lx-100 TaxID=2899081 RepID=UPI001E375CD5|nr:MetQ/NlpA family ABC transporter substrate-binding protein [Schaalia sp. lx-100]MCD4557548.1 MetQ/NlpA family ABC transporter substrate-binding protein [Schaalia sp. lx-100]